MLTWTLFALMQQPDVERKLLAELDAEVGDAAVSAPLPRAGSAPAGSCAHASGLDHNAVGRSCAWRPFPKLTYVIRAQRWTTSAGCPTCARRWPSRCGCTRSRRS